MVNFKDIVALATAGYKVSEVKELITLANQSETDPEKDKGEQKGQGEKTEQHEDGKEQPDEAQKKPTATPSEDSVILSYKQKIEELEEKVKNLQSANVHKDRSDANTKSDEEALNEITALFM